MCGKPETYSCIKEKTPTQMLPCEFCETFKNTLLRTPEHLRWLLLKGAQSWYVLIKFNAMLFRSSHQRCSIKKGVCRNFTKFAEKHLCQSLFFNKVAGLRPAILLKKRLCHRCYPLDFVEFLRIPFLQNTSGRLLLAVVVQVVIY